jgi:hypothetical protein
MTMLAKLDPYNYKIIPGKIRIKLTKTNDPILVDILSDIYNSDGRVYVEGRMFTYLDEHQIVKRGKHVFLELHVEPKQMDKIGG